MSEKNTKIKRRDFVKLAGAAALAGPSLTPTASAVRCCHASCSTRRNSISIWWR